MTTTHAPATRLLFAAAVVAAVGGAYWMYRPTQPAAAMRKPVPVEVTTSPLPLTQDEKDARYRYQVPVTPGQPSRGPTDALVTMVVWSDLRGQSARDLDRVLESVMVKFPTQLRWVHRHWFDVTQKEAHLLHNVARGVHHVAGKFWELRAELLKQPDDVTLLAPELQALTEKVGVDWAPIDQGLVRMGFAQYVMTDLRFAGMFGVTSSPGIYVNGRRFVAGSSADLQPALEALIARELKEAEAIVSSGVPASKLYKHLTENALWGVDDEPVARAKWYADREATRAAKAAEKAAGTAPALTSSAVPATATANTPQATR